MLSINQLDNTNYNCRPFRPTKEVLGFFLFKTEEEFTQIMQNCEEEISPRHAKNMSSKLYQKRIT